MHNNGKLPFAIVVLVAAVAIVDDHCYCMLLHVVFGTAFLVACPCVVAYYCYCIPLQYDFITLVNKYEMFCNEQIRYSIR